MCGIFFALSRKGLIQPDETVRQCVKYRGPDSCAFHAVTLNSPPIYDKAGCASENRVYINSFSSVLSLRGSVTVAQPLVDNTDPNGSFLCWNGEAWKVGGFPVTANDTTAVYELLQKACRSTAHASAQHAGPDPHAVAVANGLSKISGPYAFVYYDKHHGRVYFGRDFLGRRSLLIRLTTDGELALSSVTDGKTEDSWTEVEADGLYYVDLPDFLESAAFGALEVKKVAYAFIQPGLGTAQSSVGRRAHLSPWTALIDVGDSALVSKQGNIHFQLATNSKCNITFCGSP